jgi:hypothetical protein
MMVGDEIEIEVGSRLTPNFEKFDKFMLRGAGIGQLIKIPLIMKK